MELVRAGNPIYLSLFPAILKPESIFSNAFRMPLSGMIKIKNGSFKETQCAYKLKAKVHYR
ncbi:MAG: hypothetical protein C4560_05690 [Nitrospiraceae bacterium]|nr:MAG: hypothetical protein C4560_05690 [Nitrospiraceae bacterium]